MDVGRVYSTFPDGDCLLSTSRFNRAKSTSKHVNTQRQLSSDLLPLQVKESLHQSIQKYIVDI